MAQREGPSPGLAAVLASLTATLLAATILAQVAAGAALPTTTDLPLPTTISSVDGELLAALTDPPPTLAAEQAEPMGKCGTAFSVLSQVQTAPQAVSADQRMTSSASTISPLTTTTTRTSTEVPAAPASRVNVTEGPSVTAPPVASSTASTIDATNRTTGTGSEDDLGAPVTRQARGKGQAQGDVLGDVLRESPSSDGDLSDGGLGHELGGQRSDGEQSAPRDVVKTAAPADVGDVRSDATRSNTALPDVSDLMDDQLPTMFSRTGRYTSAFAAPKHQRHRGPASLQQEPSDIQKDIYIHLSDDPGPTTPTPPRPRPRKHYKIILIKPPTPAPRREEPVVRFDEEKTLIYVLLPKGDGTTPTPVTTTPKTPSEHEVFFIRYSAPTTPKSAPTSTSTLASVSTSTSSRTSASSSTGGSSGTTASTPISDDPELAAVVTSTPSSPVPLPLLDSDAILDGRPAVVSDKLDDLMTLSTDDIVRSWRQSDGDLHFDANLRRNARSHNSTTTTGVACLEQDTTAMELNAALATEGRTVEGGPDFKAVLQRRSHYGTTAAPCTEQAKQTGQPFALQHQSTQTPETPETTRSQSTSEIGGLSKVLESSPDFQKSQDVQVPLALQVAQAPESSPASQVPQASQHALVPEAQALRSGGEPDDPVQVPHTNKRRPVIYGKFSARFESKNRV